MSPLTWIFAVLGDVLFSFTYLFSYAALVLVAVVLTLRERRTNPVPKGLRPRLDLGALPQFLPAGLYALFLGGLFMTGPRFLKVIGLVILTIPLTCLWSWWEDGIERAKRDARR